MKIAHLDGGKKLEFPDETDDGAIDATVERHLQNNAAREKEENEKQDREEKTKHRSEDVRDRKASYQQADTHHSELVAMHMRGHQLMGDVKTSVDKLTKSLDKLADNAAALGKLAPAVSDLGTHIDNAVGEIVKALSAPKKLDFDNRGRAVGVSRKKDDEEE